MVITVSHRALTITLEVSNATFSGVQHNTDLNHAPHCIHLIGDYNKYNRR